MQATTSTRKCPACGQWSGWHKNPDDRCEHCGAILDPQGLKARNLREEEAFRQEQQFNITLIDIHPYDSAFTRFWKNIVRAFQITLMAIISFIIWFITILAG
ncbi:MAG TPA: hypothetical protein VK927_11455 [Adhaeribacter sp.]|nr:hypothetical protein [Adhaeribacter sp.]